MALRISTCLLFALCFCTCAGAQPTDKPGLIELPHGLIADAPMETADLLHALRWDSLSVACQRDASCRTSSEESPDGLVRDYKVSTQDDTWIQFSSYRGRVFDYTAVRAYGHRPLRVTFFDAETWTEYAHEALGEVADTLYAPADTEPDVLRAYYQLLGVGVSSEYGWICEYSTVGMAPPQRKAVIVLVDLWRIELLEQVLRGSNAEGRAYAAEALLYLDQQARAEIAAGVEASHRRYRDFHLLTEQNRTAIEMLRQSDEVVRTCGNAGSYKVYPIPMREVLSDSAIVSISDNYSNLRQLGYFSY